jgi:hypothetical protein
MKMKLPNFNPSENTEYVYSLLGRIYEGNEAANAQRKKRILNLMYSNEDYYIAKPSQSIIKKFHKEFKIIAKVINLSSSYFEIMEEKDIRILHGTDALQTLMIRMYDNLIGINQHMLSGHTILAYILLRPFLEGYLDFMIIANPGFVKFYQDNNKTYLTEDEILPTLSKYDIDSRIAMLGERYLEFSLQNKDSKDALKSFHANKEMDWEKNDYTWNLEGQKIKGPMKGKYDDWFGRNTAYKTRELNDIYGKLCDYVHGSPRAWVEIVKQTFEEDGERKTTLLVPPYDDNIVDLTYIFEEVNIINKYLDCFHLLINIIIQQWDSLSEEERPIQYPLFNLLRSLTKDLIRNEPNSLKH